jgi:hypothetical protein
VPGTFLDHTAETISYSEFVHKVAAGGRGAARAGCSQVRASLCDALQRRNCACADHPMP